MKLLIILLILLHPTAATHVIPRILPPCAYEDRDNCYWDAAHRGNGQGQSFVSLNGQVIYLPTR